MYRVCDSCGSARSSVALAFDDYYEDYFPAGVQADSCLLAERYSATLDRMERMTPGRRLLEVGCGNGHFLSVARERGWKSAGVELSGAQVEHCRGRGLEVAFGDLANDDLFPGRSFDGVVMIEVLEHLPRPRAVLGAIARRIVPRGIIYATTPNFDALSRRLLGGNWSVLNAEHVVVPTARGMRRALKACGYLPVEVRSKNVNPAELRHYLGRQPGKPMSGGARFEAAAAVRDHIERSLSLRLLKSAANQLLALTGLGDTLAIWATRMPREADRSPHA